MELQNPYAENGDKKPTPTETPVENQEQEQEFKVRGDVAKISLETYGRFSVPKVIHFRDYTTKDVSDLTLARPEDLLESLVAVLNTLVEEKIKVEDLLVEEFYEVLIGMKMQFYNSSEHTHRWMCSCQNKVPEEERKASEMLMDLAKITYTSIEKAEENFKVYLAEYLKTLSPEEFQRYVMAKYGSSEPKTIEEIVEDFLVKEPIIIKANGHTYEFQFPRVGDLIRGMKIAYEKYNGLIRRAQNKQMHGVGADQIQEIRAVEVEKLEHEKQKAAIFNSRALSLVKMDGMPLPYPQRIAEYGKIPRNVLASMVNFLEQIKFSIDYETDIVCNLCGKSEARLLQRDINFIELLPFDTGSKPASSRKSGDIASAVIFM